MISVSEVKKIYNQKSKDEFIALDKISLEVKKGEIFALKGVSGSGKSTLLSILAGFTKPSSGEVIINGESIGKLSIKFMSKFRRENIGFIFQSFNLIPTLSVLDNVLLPCLVDGAKDKKEYALSLLDKFEIADKANLNIETLSGGEKQRVAISRALVNDPIVILADEPTASLDIKLSKELMKFFEILKDEGRTIVVASHDPIVTASNLISNSYELVK